MKCSKCGNEVNVLDTSCTGCGSSLSMLDDGPQYSAESSLLDSLSSSLDAELAAMQSELFEQPGPTTEKLEPEVTTSSGAHGIIFSKLGEPPPSFLAKPVEILLSPPKEEMYQIASFVFNSSHVQSNLLYRERAAQTSLVYLVDDDIVNAYATDHPHSEIDAAPPMIILLGGMSRATQLASFVLGYDSITRSTSSRELLTNVIGALGEQIIQNGTCASDDSVEILERFEIPAILKDSEVTRRARSYGAAMNMSVIAHELGHIALGHTLSAQQRSMEISRNQEREADSFSASVASSSPFSDYTVAGGIFWWIILTWVEAHAGGGREMTHPFSRDRLMDYIRANRDQAKALGLDEDSIADFLP